MPLAMARAGDTGHIKRIGGKEEVRKFLERLGFVIGGEVRVVSENSGGIIVNVKDTTVALSREMASKILI